MTPTAQQQAFLSALVSRPGHKALRARAGCGKTSTILLGVDALVKARPTAEITVCAYNKSIADEVGAKLKARGHTNWKTVASSTLHSMGYGLLRFAFNNPKIDEHKVRDLIRAQNEPIYEHYGTQIQALVGYAKGAGVGFFFSDQAIGDVGTWHALADHFDVNGLDNTDEADAVVEAAQHIYRASLAMTQTIDFDDMVLMPLVKNLRVKFGRDVIFLDEAQDLSRARQALARKFLKPGGQMIVVGDDRQAIYGFSGADAAALPNLIEQLGAEVFPLSVTWRCPKAVVELAQSLVPDIEAAPGAPEGVVSSLPLREGKERAEDLAAFIETLGPADAVLCRNNAPLVSLAYSIIRAGKACKVEGREIGNGLVALARRWKVKTTGALLSRLEDYQEREMQKAAAKGNESKMAEVEDRCETLRQVILATQERGGSSVDDVVGFIGSLFADGATGVTVLSSAHKSKGKEWPRVFLLGNNKYCPSKGARKPWELAQEDNLQYVMYTRAQEELVFVHVS